MEQKSWPSCKFRGIPPAWDLHLGTWTSSCLQTLTETLPPPVLRWPLFELDCTASALPGIWLADCRSWNPSASLVDEQIPYNKSLFPSLYIFILLALLLWRNLIYTSPPKKKLLPNWWQIKEPLKTPTLSVNCCFSWRGSTIWRFTSCHGVTGQVFLDPKGPKALGFQWAQVDSPSSREGTKATLGKAGKNGRGSSHKPLQLKFCLSRER